MEKGLAYWIYWEDYEYYCSTCIDKRLIEINTNKEFSEYIDYEGGETCGYFEDYAECSDTDAPSQEHCCMCEKPLLTNGID